MIWFMLILAAGAAQAWKDAPPYVQSREAFESTKLYVSELLPPLNTKTPNPGDGKYYSFGIIAGVTAGVVTANKSSPAYDPLLVLHKAVPFAWSHYNVIAEAGRALLNDAKTKSEAIANLIDNNCNEESVRECNAKVHAIVLKNPYAYKQPADLLLALGKFSQLFRKKQKVIDSLTSSRHEIPYLIDNVRDSKYKEIVDSIVAVLRLLKRIQFRRFNRYG